MITTKVNGFGADPTPVSYKAIADQVRALKPKQLDPGVYSDVLEIIIFLQESVVADYDALLALKTRLEEWEADLKRREDDVKLRIRASHAMDVKRAARTNNKLIGFFRK